MNADRNFLLSAINAALTQTNRQLIDAAAAEQLSQQALGKIAFEIAKQTAIIERNSSRIRVDPQGKYNISFE